VRPQTLRGFRDFLPAEMIDRNAVVGKVRAVYEAYGFAPIDTPILELLPTLVGTGGEEADKQIFALESPEHQQIGMRFDLTVPFARVVAQYFPDRIKLPFRCYHIGPVFRADDPQPEQGRLRQFTQFDIDVAGTESVIADAEIIAAMRDTFEALGLSACGPDSGPGSYYIRFNSRQLVDAFLASLDVARADLGRHILRVMDKRDKLNESELVRELGPGRLDKSGDFIRGVGLESRRIAQILEFAATAAPSRAEVLAAVGKQLAPTPARDDALAEIESLCRHLEALGIPEEAVRLDPSLARGLDYYTGPVFEGTLPGADVGSVMGGGRYDSLVSRFLDEPMPATGASIGIDRLIAGLRNLGLAGPERRTTSEALVLVMPGVDEREAVRAAGQLRSGGVAAETYAGTAMGKVARQLAYANSLNIPVAVLLGEEEIRAGTATVKDLRAGRDVRAGMSTHEEYRSAGTAGQRTVARSDLIPAVRHILGQ
jgi:histidyl-tRNA synthetase